MDYVEILREKIERLRVEIAEIRELNAQVWRQRKDNAGAEVAYQKRRERLEAIKQELAQLADVGRKVQSAEEMKEQHRFRLHPVKKAS
jgi:hypothetical protein